MSTVRSVERRGRHGRLLLAGWSLFLVAALWFLHWAGSGVLAAPPLSAPSQLGAWVDDVGLESAIVASVRLVALALGWYLVVTTIVGAMVRVGGADGLVRATDAVTLPFVRHVLGSAGTLTAAGLTLAASPLLVPGSHPLDPPQAVASDGDGTGLDESTSAPEPGRLGVPAFLETVEPAVLEPVPAPVLPEQLELASLVPLGQADTAGVGSWTVAVGDHLWLISQETLVEAWGRPVSDAEVAGYWTSVIDVNRPNLVVPDNPDLIYPGQVMRLPAPPADPGRGA